MDLLTKIGRTLTQEDYKKLFEEGLFVFDTNVLLDLYRLPNEAKEDLFKILESKQLKNRVWLPFQVHLEYVYNKNGEIRGQNTKFDVVSDKVDGFQGEIQKLATTIKGEIDELDLKKRHSSIKAEKYINDELFKASIDKLNKFKEELSELKKKQPDIADKDVIGDRIATIFEDKVGKGFDKAELQEIYKKGADRYKNKIPPGYKDDKKEGSHFYEDKEYIKKYGDLLLWKEIIEKAKNDKTVEYIILISSDLKDDWRGKHNTVRYELLNEIYHAASELKIFHIYDSSNFMKFAKEYLNLEVSDESIQDAKDIQEDKLKNGYINLRTLIKVTADIQNLKVGVAVTDGQIIKVSISKGIDFQSYFNTLISNTTDKFSLNPEISVSMHRFYSSPNEILVYTTVLSNRTDNLMVFYKYALRDYPVKYIRLGTFDIKKITDSEGNLTSVSIELIITT